jgi:hypothetical protein
MDQDECFGLVDEFIAEQVESIRKMGSTDLDNVQEAWDEIKAQCN